MQKSGNYVCECCGQSYTIEEYEVRDGSRNWYEVRYEGTHPSPNDCLKHLRSLITDSGSRRTS